jgi:hypothetical protein
MPSYITVPLIFPSYFPFYHFENRALYGEPIPALNFFKLLHLFNDIFHISRWMDTLNGILIFYEVRDP